MAQQDQPATGGTGLGHRSVTMTRSEKGTYLVTNIRGGTLSVGGGGESADFTPVETSGTKIKKSGSAGLTLELVQTTDVLAGLVAGRTDPRQVLVGFAAETGAESGSLLELGYAKLARKGCDLLVVNEVGERKTFGAEDTEAVVLAADGTETPVPHGPKEALADTVWDLVAARLS